MGPTDVLSAAVADLKKMQSHGVVPFQAIIAALDWLRDPVRVHGDCSVRVFTVLGVTFPVAETFLFIKRNAVLVPYGALPLRGRPRQQQDDIELFDSLWAKLAAEYMPSEGPELTTYRLRVLKMRVEEFADHLQARYPRRLLEVLSGPLGVISQIETEIQIAETLEELAK